MINGKIRKFIIISYPYIELLMIMYILVTICIVICLWNYFYTTILVSIFCFWSSIIYYLYAEYCYDTHQEIINKLKNK